MHHSITKITGSVVRRHPGMVLSFALFLSLITGIASKNLKLESSFISLLPQDSKSVRDLKSFQDEFGSSNFLIILVEHSDHDGAIRFVNDFANKIKQLPEVMYVDYEKPSGFLKNRLLWYISLEDLNEIDRRVLAYIEQERQGFSPIWSKALNLTDEPDPLDFSDIEKKYSNSTDENYNRFLKGRYYEDEAGKTIALLVRPKEDSSDIENNKMFVQKIKNIEQELEPSSYSPTLKVGYTGGYQTSLDHHEYLTKEIVKVTLIVFCVLNILVFVYYRRFSAVVLIGLPLVASIAWTAGITALTLGHINMVTSFSGGALLGLGSDYGIYLLSRYLQERKRGKSAEESYNISFGKTGRATLGACLTTVAAFLVLCLSSFRAFSEFGLMGIIGVVSSCLAMFSILPSLIIICERYRIFQREERWFNDHPALNVMSSKFPLSVPIVLVIITFIGFFIWQSKDLLTIDYDLKKIEDYKFNIASLELEKKADTMFQNTLRPAIIVAENRNEEREIISTLQKRNEVNPKVFEKFIALSSFLPDKIEAKREKINKIRQHWNNIATSIVRNQYKEEFDNIEEPITEKKLPYELKRLFLSPQTGSTRSLVYVVSGVDRSNVKNMEMFGSAIRNINLSSGRVVSSSGSWMILYDIIKILNKDAPLITLLTLFFVVVILLLTLKHIWECLLISLGLIMGLFLFVSLMAVTGLHLNILNVALVPIIIGTGIDSFIHFYYRYREEETECVGRVWNKISPAILIANLTTLIGFGGFALSSNSGLQSIGLLAIIGVIAIVIASLLLYPAFLQIIYSQKSRQATEVVCFEKLENDQL